MASFDLPQRVPTTDDLANHFQAALESSPDIMSVLEDIFVALTEPDLAALPLPEDQAREFYQKAMAEWLMYDGIDDKGLGILGHAAMADRSLAECAGTQFYSLFHVIEQDPASSTALLREFNTGGQYLVHDERIAAQPHYAKGILGARLTHVDGKWHNLSTMYLHDNDEAISPCDHDPDFDDVSLAYGPAVFVHHIWSLVSPLHIGGESLSITPHCS